MIQITPEYLASSGSESGHQKALFCWAQLNFDKYPQLKYMYAIPNGFFGSAGQKAKMIAEGLKSGVPDICLPCHGWDISVSGLYIELKVQSKKRITNPMAGTSDEQKEWIDFLLSQDYEVHVAYGWEEARDIIIKYLEG